MTDKTVNFINGLLFIAVVILTVLFWSEDNRTVYGLLISLGLLGIIVLDRFARPKKPD